VKSPNKSHPGKSTFAEAEKRRQIVFEMYCHDESYSGIVRYCAENWGIKARQTQEYISQAKKKLEKEALPKYEEELKKALIRRQRLKRKAEQAGDLRLVLDIEKDEGKLRGLYIERIDHTTKGESMKNITVEVCGKESPLLKALQDETNPKNDEPKN
jgi:hypothetical protein